MIATQPKQKLACDSGAQLARHLPGQNKANSYLSSLPYIHNQQKRSIAIQILFGEKHKTKCLQRL